MSTTWAGWQPAPEPSFEQQMIARLLPVVLEHKLASQQREKDDSFAQMMAMKNFEFNQAKEAARQSEEAKMFEAIYGPTGKNQMQRDFQAQQQSERLQSQQDLATQRQEGQLTQWQIGANKDIETDKMKRDMFEAKLGWAQEKQNIETKQFVAEANRKIEEFAKNLEMKDEKNKDAKIGLAIRNIGELSDEIKADRSELTRMMLEKGKITFATMDPFTKAQIESSILRLQGKISSNEQLLTNFKSILAEKLGATQTPPPKGGGDEKTGAAAYAIKNGLVGGPRTVQSTGMDDVTKNLWSGKYGGPGMQIQLAKNLYDWFSK